jgi:hypothetical protein
MNLKTAALALVLGSFSAWAPAGDLPPEVAAKLIKIIATATGGKVSCRDSAMKAALEAAGITVDSDSKIVWAVNPVEIKMLRTQNRLVITGNKSFLANGAGIAIVEDGGKPKIFLHQPNIAASGVALSDAIYKVGEK